MRDHGSIGLFREWCFGEEFGSECLGVFLFCFCLVWGEKVTSPKDFGWRSKGEDHSKSWFPSFSCLLVYLWQFCIVQILPGPKTFLYFVFFRPLIGNCCFFFFLLSSNLDWEFSSFAFFRSLIKNFLFFVFFWGQGLTFSPWVKVYGKLGFWRKACRTARHDICQGVGLASSSGIKGMSHIVSMTHMQQRWFGNFMQNWSCMHPCGHSSIKFLWSCDTRAQDLFFPI